LDLYDLKRWELYRKNRREKKCANLAPSESAVESRKIREKILGKKSTKSPHFIRIAQLVVESTGV